MDLPPKWNKGFPLKENCNLDDPFEAFLWMLVALPGQNGGQLVMPISYLQLVSKRLWDCGARPVEEPVIKYRKPLGVEPNWMTSPGRWVDVDTPDPDPRPPARVALDSLISQQRAELFTELAKDLTPAQRKAMIADAEIAMLQELDDDPA